MIEREYQTQFIVCDGCEDAWTEPYDRDDFNRMIQDAKEAGWSVRSGRGEWVHKCPVCARDEEREFEEVEI